jgi:hypothetical protein
MNDDPGLHEIFQAERAAQRAGVPPFARVRAGRVRRRSRRLIPGLLAAGGALAALAIALRVHARSEPMRDLELARQVMAWRSNTDFLLPASPGLLTSVPRIGHAPSGSPLEALDPGSPLGPPELPRSPRS